MQNDTRKTYAAPRLDDRGSINAGTLGSDILLTEAGVPPNRF